MGWRNPDGQAESSGRLAPPESVQNQPGTLYTKPLRKQASRTRERDPLEGVEP